MSDLNAADAGTMDGNANGSEGAIDNAWLSSVPENLRGNDILKGHASLPEALQGYVDLKVKSGNMIAKPTEKSTPEEIAAYRKALNVPDTVDGYEVGKPENWPKTETGEDKYLFDETFHADFLKLQHEKGVPKELAQATWKAFTDYQIKAFNDFEAFQTERKAHNSELLTKEWGEKLQQKRAETIEVLNRYESTLKDDDTLSGKKAFQEIRKTIENEPEWISFVNNLFSKIGNDGHIGGEGVIPKNAGASWYPNTPAAN